MQAAALKEASCSLETPASLQVNSSLHCCCLQAAVRDEAARSLDPLRRLPELVAAAMPVTPEVLGPDSSLVSASVCAGWLSLGVLRSQPRLSYPGSLALCHACWQSRFECTPPPTAPPLHPFATPRQPAMSEESLRALLGEQLREATQRILEQQEALLEELAGQPQVRWGDSLIKGGC